MASQSCFTVPLNIQILMASRMYVSRLGCLLPGFSRVLKQLRHWRKLRQSHAYHHHVSVIIVWQKSQIHLELDLDRFWRYLILKNAYSGRMRSNHIRTTELQYMESKCGFNFFNILHARTMALWTVLWMSMCCSMSISTTISTNANMRKSLALSLYSYNVGVRLYSFLLMYWCIIVDTSCIYITIISILQHGIQCQSTCCFFKAIYLHMNLRCLSRTGIADWGLKGHGLILFQETFEDPVLV